MSVTVNDLTEGLLDELGCETSIGTAGNLPVGRRRRPERGPDGAESRLIALARTIEGEIVPRLLMARRDAPSRAQLERHPVGVPATVGATDVEELVRLLLAHDSTVASAFTATIEQRGVPLESICLQLLAPAARRLGELWSEDRADLIQVTLALCRLQTLLRELSLGHRTEVDHREHRRAVLLVPAIGEQHTFGVQLVAEFFRRAHWDVWAAFPSSNAELLELVSRERFAIVGLSVGCEKRLAGLAERVKAVRGESRNRSVGIMVGGRTFTDHPEQAAAVGADATAADGHQAALTAERLLKRLTTVD